MLWMGDCPSARVHGLLLAWRARLSMGDTFFGAWQRNRSTGGARQRRKRCAAEQTAAVSLNRSESDLWLARPKLGLLKADRGGRAFFTPFTHPFTGQPPAPARSRPRSSAQRRPDSLTYSRTHLPLSWLAWTTWTCLWEARLARRREAGRAANTLQHSQSTGAAL